MPLIELKHVVGGYGGAPILNGVNIAIEKTDIGVIVGPNGAGKSTTLKAIFGLLKVTGGTIDFGGENIANSLPDKLVPKGLSFVPQEKNVFTSMTVEENLEMGAFIRRDDYRGTMDWVYQMFPVLAEQNARQALAFASRGFVLASGQNRFTGTGPELIADPEVAKSFLGG